MSEQWVPHQRDTWPTRYGTLKTDTTFSHWTGKHGSDGPIMIDRIVPAGTRVKIVMVSRFGDVGITEDLASDCGYEARVQLEDLDGLQVAP